MGIRFLHISVYLRGTLVYLVDSQKVEILSKQYLSRGKVNFLIRVGRSKVV